MPNTHQHIGEAIRARREALGLTQEELCVRLGWKPSRFTEISRLEMNPSANPTLNSLLNISNALDCRLADLVIMLNADKGAA